MRSAGQFARQERPHACRQYRHRRRDPAPCCAGETISARTSAKSGVPERQWQFLSGKFRRIYLIFGCAAAGMADAAPLTSAPNGKSTVAACAMVFFGNPVKLALQEHQLSRIVMPARLIPVGQFHCATGGFCHCGRHGSTSILDFAASAATCIDNRSRPEETPCRALYYLLKR